MRLPRGLDAVVDIAKLREYCLNPHHPRGRHKARVFQAALGIGQDNAGELRTMLLEAAARGEATEGLTDGFGRRFTVDLNMTRGSRQAIVRSAWIVLRGESFPRLTSCFVLLN